MNKEITKTKVETRTITMCGLFAALTAIGAFIRIPLPIVPFTLQFFFVALSGILLGAKKGVITQLIYVGIGLAGVPVFTKGGGISYVFQPTFGYLLGFIVAAFVMGKIVDKRKVVTLGYLLIATLIGMVIIYAIGVPYMYMIINLYIGAEMSIERAIAVGLVPFIPGDLLSCIATAIIGVKLIPTLRSMQVN